MTRTALAVVTLALATAGPAVASPPGTDRSIAKKDAVATPPSGRIEKAAMITKP